MGTRSFVLLIIGCLILSCQADHTKAVLNHDGRTMGTTYHVKACNCQFEVKKIDSLLNDINLAVSTYIDSSLISKFNRSNSGLVIPKDQLGDHFETNFDISSNVNELSAGAFDPTVMPLVNLWGFGYAEKDRSEFPDSIVIDSTLDFIGFEKISVEQEGADSRLVKSNPEVELDFSAVAKGYAVDRLGEFLEASGCASYMVEIGGEVRCRGMSPKGRPWAIGVQKPIEHGGKSELSAVVHLKNKSMATSGNYQNFYEIDGKKVSHSINPRTGYPERSELLSATIVNENCANADAVATACMILGLELSKEMISQIDGYEAFFIFGSDDGAFGEWQSEGFPDIQIIE